MVRKVERTFDGYFILEVVGLSPLVRDNEWTFMTEVDDYTLIDPKDTRLVPDGSAFHATGRLHIESLLRATPPPHNLLSLGHRGAMDDVPYQRLPALWALEQPRPRILIADGTGLGKTIEAGILISELIRRGRGKRILVVALKSMLTQFQKEMWTRFSIPLIRLDTAGIKRVEAQLPDGHNPFNFHDRTIISIDTLKQARRYREHIRGANWDIIVIDEAHNVAKRGMRSHRHRLAELLSDRADAMIMLSATPHDGRRSSFASLISMLDPTAIADPLNYTKDDLEGKNLFVRRHKKDIRSQVVGALKQRSIELERCVATEAEEQAFAVLADSGYAVLARRAGVGLLIRTLLEKAVLSSPAACLETVRNRKRTLAKKGGRASELEELEDLEASLEEITASDFSKYQMLLALIRSWNWKGRDSQDRLLIFTERIATLEFLREHLAKDLRLRKGALEVLHGSLTDVEQQEIVENFGQEGERVRVLVSTDVGSEGINLHYQCHRLVHFDIPWSLMLLQQRNGRIDRYGQQRKPKIYYLLTESRSERFRGDQRILELLIEKEKEAEATIGDPASLMAVFEVAEEEKIVAKVIEKKLSEEEAERHMFYTKRERDDTEIFDPLKELLGELEEDQDLPNESVRPMPSLFDSDYGYLQTALPLIQDDLQERAHLEVDVTFAETGQHIDVVAGRALASVRRTLPVEARPEHGRFLLTACPQTMMRHIAECKAQEESWPKTHYLWPVHPVMDYVADRVRLLVGRMDAPAISLDSLREGAAGILITALYPNRKGRTVLQRWYLVRIQNDEIADVDAFEATEEFVALQRGVPNSGCDDAAIRQAQRWIAAAVNEAQEHSMLDYAQHVAKTKPELDRHLQGLKARRDQHRAVVAERFAGEDRLTAGRRLKELERTEASFDDYRTWIEANLTIEPRPYLQVVAAFVSGANGV